MSEPERTREEYQDALYWVLSELRMAKDNPQYMKSTLITNLMDRVTAALRVWPYTPRPETTPEAVPENSNG